MRISTCCLRIRRYVRCLSILITTAIVISHSASARDVNIGLNFTGADRNASGFIPPDTMGTVGPNHVVELINGRYRVYDKLDGTRRRNRSLDQFWIAAGAPPNGAFSFDPRVQYDPSVDRYFATSVDNAAGPNNFLVAVSNTNDPLDGWTGFKIDADTSNQQWADFPQMGFSDDAIVISGNMFGLDGGDFEINMLVLPKADLVAAVPSIANATLLENLFAPSGFLFSLQSAIDMENLGRPLRLFSTSSTGSRVGVVQIDNPLTSPSLNNIPDVTGLINYPSPPLADQPGPKQNLESGGDRTRSAVTLIDGYYYGVHGVGISNRAALRWYKIDADTMTLAEEGVISDPQLDFIYGSIAASEFGDVVIGFTGTGANQFPSAYAVVGETDNTGTLSFDQPVLLKAGVSDYEALDSRNRNRWGDYSSTVIDPEDPFTFWTFQEFVVLTDNYAIQITELNLVKDADFNRDGLYDCVDIDALVADIAAGTDTALYDLTDDGLVNGDDLTLWLSQAGEINLGPGKTYLVGDATLDGNVDGSDFLAWNDNRFTALPEWCGGDFNADGFVDGFDFTLWNDNRFTSSDSVVSVPEPGGVTLFFVTLGILLNKSRGQTLFTVFERSARLGAWLDH